MKIIEPTGIAADTGAAEATLQSLVTHFYDRVRADELLGPVFAGAVQDWPAHLRVLTDFWSSVMLASGRYKGNPLARHAMHRHAMTAAHFDRWLALWSDVTAAQMPPETAHVLQAKARRIASSLQQALLVNAPSAHAPIHN